VSQLESMQAAAPGVARYFAEVLNGRPLGVFGRLLGLGRFREVYREARGADEDAPFARRALAALGIRYEIRAGDLDAVPDGGPVVLAANHPFGMADGLVLLDLMARSRGDGRILSNAVMAAVRELAGSMISVDAYGGEEAARANLRAIRASVRWLRSGGILATFPAGDVARLAIRRRRVVEAPWGATVAKLVRSARATVVPVHIEGRNSAVFQGFGALHPRVRTALLVRELLRMRGRTVGVRIGRPVSFEDLHRVRGHDERAAWLRLRTLDLARPGTASVPPLPRTEPAPFAVRTCNRAIRDEIDALPPDRRLVSGGGFRTVLFRADEAPAAMREIGRLREITFRAVGEGTGRGLDLDGFDPHYRHLVLWHEENSEIAGAYRLGATDEILPGRGPAGLYTTTLFRMSRRLLRELTPGLEMGRSFVRAEYQRSFQPLLQLWKGIGAFVVANPRYRLLFGPVSISASYR